MIKDDGKSDDEVIGLEIGSRKLCHAGDERRRLTCIHALAKEIENNGCLWVSENIHEGDRAKDHSEIS